MGMHRIEITMVGGHGCDRKAKAGDPLYGCQRMDCPDCAFRALVERFSARGCFSNGVDCGATITHWPGTDGEVVDDLVAGKRIKGAFER